MATIRTWLKQFFSIGFDQSSRSGSAQNKQTHCATATVPQGTTTQSSAERAAYWQTRQDIPPEAHMAEWEALMEAFLTPMKTDAAKQEQYAFLKRILREPDQHFDTVEVTPTVLYKTFIQAGNGDVEYFAKRIADTNTHEQIRHNAHLIKGLAEIYGSETGKRALPLILALKTSHSHKNGQAPSPAPSAVLGFDRTTGMEAAISHKDRQEGHVYVCGVSGMGKSVLLLNMILADIRAGYGVALIEPHDLTAKVLAGIPDERLPDVVYLDMTDLQSVFSVNLFAVDDPTDMNEVARAASFVMHLFERVWNIGTHTPQLAQVLRNVTRTCIEARITFAEIPLLLWDETVRAKTVAQVTNPQTRLFWEQYNLKSPRERSDLVSSTMNKADAYLNEPLIANIVSQANTSIDFRKLMDEGKILLVNMPRQYEELSRFVGSLLIGKLLMAAFSRLDIQEQERRQFYLYVDEFQHFCSSEFRNFLEESRKVRVSTTIAHQSLSQLPEEHRIAATGAASMIVFRVLGDESRLFARSYDATPEQVQVGFEPLRVPASDILTHLVKRGHQDGRVARFAGTSLATLENFVQMTTGAKEWCVTYNSGVDGGLILYDKQVQDGRKLLNQTLYACMSEAKADLPIPFLAIFMLACSQRNGMELVFSKYVNHDNHGFFFGPFSLRDFTPDAARFGEANFTQPERSAKYIAAVAKAAKKQRWMAEAVVGMLTELRYVMTALSQSPILVDTGQLVPKYQLRSYQDQENAIANTLSQLPPYTAKVRLVSGEHTIATQPPPPLLPEHEVQARIAAIKERMLLTGITRPYPAVAEEIRKRHEHLRERPPSDAPPPSHTNGNRRRRNRPRPPDTHA